MAWQISRDGVVQDQRYPDQVFAAAAQRGMMRTWPDSSFELREVVGHGSVPCWECTPSHQCKRCEGEPLDINHCPRCGDHP